jgi:hypothetical protein
MAPRRDHVPAPWRAVQAALAPAAPPLPARLPWTEGEREHALRATSGGTSPAGAPSPLRPCSRRLDARALRPS